jgi:hypothetical protein
MAGRAVLIEQQSPIRSLCRKPAESHKKQQCSGKFHGAVSQGHGLEMEMANFRWPFQELIVGRLRINP